jgi:hypothetical protein
MDVSGNKEFTGHIQTNTNISRHTHTHTHLPGQFSSIIDHFISQLRMGLQLRIIRD